MAPESGAPKPGDSSVQSFARGLEVIRSFSATAPEQTLSEVASAHGPDPRAARRRILLTLQTLGYVESDGKLVRLTPRILDLGFAYLSSLPIWDLAEPLMEGLVEEVRESSSPRCSMAPDIVYVLRVPTHKIMRTSLGVGSRLPAACTSVGARAAGHPARCRAGTAACTPARAAAHRPDRDRHAHADRAHPPGAPAGWSLVEPGAEEGLISMAAPLTNRAGQTVAAMNISGQANRTSAEGDAADHAARALASGAHHLADAGHAPRLRRRILAVQIGC